MTPEYVRLRQEMTVSDAFAAIRKQGENAETVYTCYVVERNRLLGVVSARSLLLSDPSTPIVDIMDDNVVTVKVTDDQEFVAREMQRYDFTAMPVLDNEGMFVGIITIDDAIDVLTDESTEDTVSESRHPLPFFQMRPGLHRPDVSQIRSGYRQLQPGQLLSFARGAAGAV